MLRSFRRSPLHAFALRLITAVFTAHTLLLAGPAIAQVVPDRTAVSGTRSLVDAAANGVPLLHIAPPSKAGVSVNVFDQFNVPQQGLILNNSTGNVQTQLGGWIKGNLQLGLTPARIIVNEISGTSRSELRGTLEVAGQRADIVIANPNGILCDGCGFLNADRATLSTGRPVYAADGSLAAFDVRQGAIEIGAGGLDATQQQQLDLYARGLVVQGEAWAQKIASIIGANRVLHGTLEALPESSPLTGAGAAPRFAVDIKELGGMYAGRIWLIATEKGLGVNSAGRTASLAGNLVLSSQGDLSLKDSFASQDVQLASAGSVTLAGQTIAQGTAHIEAPVQLANSGTLQASRLELITPRIDNAGSIVQNAPAASLALVLPGGLANSGSIYTPADFTVQAASITPSTLANTQGVAPNTAATGQLLAGGSLQVSAGSIELGNQSLAANGDLTVQAQALHVTGSKLTAGANVIVQSTGPLDAGSTTVSAGGSIRIAGSSVGLDHVQVAAPGDVRMESSGSLRASAADASSNANVIVQAASIDWRASSINAGATASLTASGELKAEVSQVVAGQLAALKGQGISTAGSTVAAPKVTIDAGAGALGNAGGKIMASSDAADALVVKAAGIANQRGQLQSNGGLALDAGGARIDNSGGVIAGTSGSLNHMGSLVNAGGTLFTQSDLAIAGTALDNTGGTIATAASLSVITPGQAIQNAGGTLQASGSITLDAGSAAIDNAGGTVSANGNISLKSGALAVDGGTLATGSALTVSASSVQAAGAKLGSDGAMTLAIAGAADFAQAKLSAGGPLTLQAGDVRAAGAQAASGADLQLSAANIAGGMWAAQGNATASAQGVLDLANGGLVAGGNVKATAGSGIVTDGAQVAGRNVRVDAGTGSLSNVGGSIVAADSTGMPLAISARGIDNTRGVIASAGDANIDAQGLAVNNRDGTIQAAGMLDMRAGELVNHGGTLSSDSSIALRGFALDNAAGTIASGGSLLIDTGGRALDNDGGKLIAQGDTTISAGAIGNVRGVIYAGGAASVHGTSIDTTRGQITGGRQLDVVAGRSLTANGATFASTGRVSIAAGSLAAHGAMLQAGTGLGVTATGALDVGGATLTSLGPQAGAIEVSGASIDAQGASITGDDKVTLQSGRTLQADGARISTFRSLSVQAATQLSANGASLKANEALSVSAGEVSANGAAISSGAAVQVTAATGRASLTGATLLSGESVQVTSAGAIAAANATIGAAGEVTLNAAGAVDTSNAIVAAGTRVTLAGQGAINNRGGQIVAGTQASLSGTSLDNTGGVIDANGTISVHVSEGTVINDQGRITTRDVLTMDAPAQVPGAATALSFLSNRGGTINSTGALELQLHRFDNAQGNITALAGLGIGGGAVDNTGGTLASQRDVVIDTAGGAFRGAGGHVLSQQGAASVNAGAITLDGGNVLAQGDVAVVGTQLHADGSTFSSNTGALRLDAGAGAASLDNARISASGDVHVSSGQAISASSAQVESGAAATISAAQGVALDHGSVVATSVAIDAGQGALENTGGLIAATGSNTLNLRSQGLANDGGQISSNGALSLHAGSGALGNALGTIVAVGSADIVSGALDNRGGLIAANGDVSVNASQAIDNSGARIASGGKLTVSAAGSLANANGTIQAAGTLAVQGNGLDNRAGVVFSKGALVVNAAATSTSTGTDNTAGIIQSGESSLVLTTGSLANSRVAAGDAGSVIAAATDLTVTASGAIDNTRSEMSAGRDLSVFATGDLANDAARLVGMRTLSVAAASIANTQGFVGANGSVLVTAGAGGLTNTQGTVQAGGDLAIRSQGLLSNASGALQARGQLQASGTAIDNDQGNIGAQAGSVTLSGTSYSGVNAAVMAGGALSLDTNGGALTANGASFASQGAMTLAAGSGAGHGAGGGTGGGAVQLNDASLVSNGSLTLTGSSLQADRINAQAAANLSVTTAGPSATGGLQSSQSTWVAGQSLALSSTGAVALQDATLFGNTSASVRGKSVDLGGASLQSPGNVSAVATGGALKLADATLVAGKDLVATGTGAGSRSGATLAAGRDLTIGNGALFDFAAPDFQYQFGRDLTVHAQGINTAGQDISARNLTLDAGNGLLINAGGTLQATGSVSASGRGIDNTGGTIAANGQVTADAGSGTLNNASGRIYSVNGSTRVSGATIANASGTISGAVDVDITGGDLLNTHNTIVAGRDLTVTVSGVVHNNDAGVLLAQQGAARISANGIDNTGGTISGQTDVVADAGSGTLENTLGLVQGTKVSVGGAVNNAGGVISGLNSVSMSTRAIDNDAGVIESGAGGITIDTHGNDLANTHSADKAGIVSQGAITIKAGSVNNETGYIGASDTLGIATTGDVNNRSGVLLGLNGVALDAGSATVDNRGGKIQSAGNIVLDAGTLNNSGAGSTVFAGGDLTVNVKGAIDNSNTKSAAFDAGLLARGNASITAATIDNTNGAIIALKDNSLRASVGIVNAGGQIAGNTVTLDAPLIINTAGRVDAQSMLNLNSPQLTTDGVLASNGGMTLNLQGDVTNTGTFSANGSLTVTTTGSMTNQGHVSALGDLTLKGTAIDNQAGAIIDAPGKLTLDAGSGTVTNAGTINSTGDATNINAGTIANTGKIYGNSVTLTAGSIDNSMTADGVGAVIASRTGNVTLNGDLNNTNNALVLSAGDITVSGTARNAGSTIDAAGNITLNGPLYNTNTNFTTQQQTTTTALNDLYITKSDSTTRYRASDLGYTTAEGGNYVAASATYPFASFGTSKFMDAVQQTCVNQGDCVASYYYADTDPVWALFKVTSPATLVAPVMPASTGNCLALAGASADSGFVRDTTGACGTYWTAYDQYNSQVVQLQTQLGDAIKVFNADVESRYFIDWYETTITSQTVTQDVVVTSQPGQVLAGGGIHLSGGLNDKSVVSAGGLVDGVPYVQVPAQGFATTTQTGTILLSHRTFSGLCDCYGREVGAPQPIASAPVTNSITLAIAPIGFTPPSLAVTTPIGGALATVPQPTAPTGTNRGNTQPPAPTGTLATGTPTSTSGGAVNVDSKATTAAGDAPNVTHVNTGVAATVAAGTGVSTNLNNASPAGATISTPLADGVGNPLRGSVIAGVERASQTQSIAKLQTAFATQAAVTPQYVQPIAVHAATAPAPVKAAGYRTVAYTSSILAPNNQLFALNRAPGARYLVETDPAYTDYRQWASSDWMLAQLAMDPERQLKLYGDGFAEQQLVTQEILALTGQRFLVGYSTTEDEFLALMNAGVMFARQFQLKPGVALTAAQMALLTTDIVWLQMQTVQLPDGSTTQVLAPVVYLRRPATGDLTVAGAITSGSNVTLRTTGDASLGGTVLAWGDAANGGGTLDLQASNLTTTGTIAGHAITLDAAGTLDATAAVVKGLGQGSSATLNGTDIVLRTTTQSSTASIHGPNGTSTGTTTNVDRVATITADSVKLAALNNIVLQGASIKATDGNLTLDAGGKVVNEQLVTGYSLDVPVGGLNGARTGYFSLDSTTQQLTTLQGGDVSVVAKGDVSLQGTDIGATGTAFIKGANVNLTPLVNSLAIDQQGVSGSGYERVAQETQTLAGGVITATGRVTIQATNGDVIAPGAQITSVTGTTTISATGDVRLNPLLTQQSSTYELAKSSSGLFANSSSVASNTSTANLAQTASVSGATVVITAGHDVLAQGANIVSDNGTSIHADNDVILKAATDSIGSTSYSQESKSGLGALGGLSIGDKQTTVNQGEDATKAVVTNVASLNGNISISAGNVYDQAGVNLLAPHGDVSVSATKVVGDAAMEQDTTKYDYEMKQSGLSVSVGNPILDAGRTIASVVDAAGKTDDPRMQALAVATAGLAVYNAASALKDPAAAASVGITLTLGTSKSDYQSSGQVSTAVANNVMAGGKVSFSATGAGADSTITLLDTNITSGGGQAFKADGVVLIGAAASTSQFDSRNSSSSSSLSLGVNIGAKGTGYTAGVAASQGSGTSAGTTTTWNNSHITAGGTVTIDSGGNTTLNGAVIDAPQVTGTIGGQLILGSLQDTSVDTLHNTSSGFGFTVPIGGVSVGPGASVSGSTTNIDSTYASVNEQTGIHTGDGGFQLNVNGGVVLNGAVITSTQAAIDAGVNSLTHGGPIVTTDITNTSKLDASALGGTLGVGSMLGSTTAGFGTRSDNASSVTTAGISGNAGDTSVRTGDAQTGLAPPTSIASAQADVNAQVQITSAFSQNATTAWGTFANDQLGKATTPDEAACWAADGACRVVGHALIGALAGGVEGAAGAALSTSITPQIAKAISDAGITGLAASALTSAVAAGLGSIAGGSAGAAAAVNEVSNNYLTSAQWNDYATKLAACGAKSGGCTQTEFNALKTYYVGLSAQQDKELAAACVDLNSPNCRTLVKQAAAGSATQLQLALSKQLPENFTAGGDLNSSVNLWVQKINAQDVMNTCNADRQQCNASTVVAAAKVVLTTASIAAAIALAPALAAEGAAIVSEGVITYCTRLPQSCAGIATAASEAAAGVPVSGVNVPVSVPTLAAGRPTQLTIKVDPVMLDELASAGVKFTASSVIATGRSQAGQVVFLETGNSTAGLQHILDEHAQDFATIGVSVQDVAGVVMQAVTQGRVVGYQGQGTGRPIYEVFINGQAQGVAVTVGSNGFIVGANPTGALK